MKNLTGEQVADVLPLSQLVAMLDRFIRQRPGFEWGNYGSAAGYRADLRRAGQQRADALMMLGKLEIPAWQVNPVDYGRHVVRALADELTRGGRLSLSQNESGAFVLEYCTGQYFPTEYRGAACRVLAAAWWALDRDGIETPTGDKIRRNARNRFGRRIAETYFR